MVSHTVKKTDSWLRNFSTEQAGDLELGAPFPCIAMVLLLSSIATAYGWEISYSFNAAFLNENLHNTEILWIKSPKIQGFVASGKIVRLIKAF